MNMTRAFGRRRVLRGMLGGAAVTVGVPLLDCFLNTNGTALAGGTALPLCFGTWFQGLGLQPGQWEPKTTGANFEFGPLLQAMNPYKKQINIFSGMKVFLDGKSNAPHIVGPQVVQTGGIPGANQYFPSIDTLIADAIGAKTRFRSIEVSCDGTSKSWSHRGSAPNPAESSPTALYTRVFGPEFKDPNAADFTPDPVVMARRSVLSLVGEQRADLVKNVGAADRAHLDEYFTSLRELEQQLDLQLQKPAPLEACTVPDKPQDATLGLIIDDALANNRLFAKLIAHAMACNQTQVFNLNFGDALSHIRRAGATQDFHMYTHEDAVDDKLGYQPAVVMMQGMVVSGVRDFVDALAAVREGPGTLLDRTLLYYNSDVGLAKIHGLENIPLMMIGGAGGRIKTGQHIQAQNETVTRVGLTIMQALGVPIGNWGLESNQSTKAFSEVIA